jgi:hypothetical protein
MLNKHRDIIKSLVGSSFIVVVPAFVYIAAYYYERSYLIALDVPKEYAVTVSEVRLVTYIWKCLSSAFFKLDEGYKNSRSTERQIND